MNALENALKNGLRHYILRTYLWLSECLNFVDSWLLYWMS